MNTKEDTNECQGRIQMNTKENTNESQRGTMRRGNKGQFFLS